MDTQGRTGGVVVVSAGLVQGSTGSAGPGPSYATVVGVDHRGDTPRLAHRFGVSGYGEQEHGRWGAGGTLALVAAREPDAYRGKVGFAIGAGLRLRLAGTDPSRFHVGPCLSNDGDRVGLVLTSDVDIEWLRGDHAHATRFSLPTGLELRVNLVP